MICPKCKKTSQPRAYADDVWKIHDFLAERGVRTYMWGEKMLKAVSESGIADVFVKAYSGVRLALSNQFE